MKKIVLTLAMFMVTASCFGMLRRSVELLAKDPNSLPMVEKAEAQDVVTYTIKDIKNQGAYISMVLELRKRGRRGKGSFGTLTITAHVRPDFGNMIDIYAIGKEDLNDQNRENVRKLMKKIQFLYRAQEHPEGGKVSVDPFGLSGIKKGLE